MYHYISVCFNIKSHNKNKQQPHKNKKKTHNNPSNTENITTTARATIFLYLTMIKSDKILSQKKKKNDRIHYMLQIYRLSDHDRRSVGVIPNLYEKIALEGTLLLEIFVFLPKLFGVFF